MRRPGTPVPVKVAAVLVEDVPIYLSGIGTVQAYNTVNVQSRIDGEVIEIHFQEGQDVKQGDVLAVIDPKPLQAQLEQQIAIRQKDQALLDGAVLDMKRYDTLVLKDFATRQQVDQQHALVDQYRAQVINDEAQIDYARNQLSYTTIRAPIGGRVGIRQLDRGNFVRASDRATIVTITQLQPISVVFTLAAVAVGQTRLSLGQVSAPAVALGPDNTSELDRGAINLVDNQVDQTTGTIKLKATFPNPENRLWPGAFVGVQVQVDTAKDAIVLPPAAVQRGPRSTFVYVVNPDSSTTRRNVKVGHEDAQASIITEGVKIGEKVVIDGASRLNDGSKVTVVQPGAAEGSPAADQPAAPGTRRRRAGASG
jgi:multidrug efflux system membrane fusion protein